MKTIGSLTLAVTLLLSGFSVSAQYFSDNNLSGAKERHCNRMVSKHGWISGTRNDAVKPLALNWVTSNIDKPGWFSEDLYIVKEQLTADGFRHLARCHWDEVGNFSLDVFDQMYGDWTIGCYDFGSFEDDC